MPDGSLLLGIVSLTGNASDVHLKTAILQTVAYSDVFDYPLMAGEIHRYLVGMAATPEAVERALAQSPPLDGRLERRGAFCCLPGRTHIIDERIRRAAWSAQVWPKAVQYGRLVADLPFVNMVALTGALTMDNVDPGDDIDLLMVTRPGRLWLARLMTMALVHLAAHEGITLCPNYWLSAKVLAFTERDLFTAHEVAQMVPIVGEAVYGQLRAANPWVAELLPNAVGPPRRLEPGRSLLAPLGRPAELVLRTPVGGWLDRWEMSRKLPRLAAKASGAIETSYTRDRCKGHTGGHRVMVLEAYQARLEQLQFNGT